MYVIELEAGDKVSIYASGQNGDANVGYSIINVSINSNIELLGSDLDDESSSVSKEYKATKSGRILVNLFTTKQSNGSSTTQYCKKNGEALTPIRADDGINYHYLDCFIIDVNKDDIISLYGRGADSYGDCGYTMRYFE